MLVPGSKSQSLPIIYAFLMLASYISPTGGLRRLVPTSNILRFILDDFTLHFFSFALLAWLLCLGYARSSRRSLSIIKIAALSLLYGWLIEIVQNFLPYRTFSLWDLMADALGIGAACLLFRIFFYHRLSVR